MKSLFYVEEDFVAGLLKDYFVVGSGDTADFVRRGSNGLANRLSKDTIDLFLAQSEDPEKVDQILELVRRQERKIPTLILTSHSDAIPQPLKSFAHCVSLPELLESNLRWHVRLQKHSGCSTTFIRSLRMRRRVAILLQDDPDPTQSAAGWRSGRFWDATSKQRRWLPSGA